MSNRKRWVWMGAALALATAQVRPAWAGGCCGGDHDDHGSPQAGKSDVPKGAPVADKDIQKQREMYPVNICPVSGDELGGEMGEPYDIVHEGRLLRLCCKGCVKDFNKDPKKCLDKLDQMIIEKQKPSYPLNACVVSGDELGGEMGEPIDHVYQNRLVRFCCKGCIKDFKKDPEKYMAKIGQPKKEEKKETAPPKKGHGGHDHKGHGH